MQVIDYGVFEKVLYSYVKTNFNIIRGTDKQEDFTAALLQINNGYKVVINKDTSSKYRTGKRPLSNDILRMFIGPKARKNVIENFKYSFVNLVPRGQTYPLIRDYVTLVEADTEMDVELKEQILSEANPTQLPEFLADILMYAVQIDPTKTNQALRDLSGTALTVLIDNAVPEVVKRVLALQYLQHNDSPEVIEALKEDRFEDLLETLANERRMSGKEYYQWCNILKITGMAQDELLQNANDNGKYTVSPEFDIGWYMQFFEYAGNISDEEMQRWWAKLLAGEIGQPKRFSKSTLRVLYEMSYEDAKLFTVAARVAISARAESDYPPFLSDTDHLGCYYLFGSRMVLLNECGLIESPRTIQVYTGPRYLFENRNKRFVISITKKDPSYPPIKLPVDVYFFTRAGKELLSLLPESDDDFLFLLAESLKKTHKDHYDIKVCSYNNVNKRLSYGKLKRMEEKEDGTTTYEYEIINEEIEDDDLLTDFSFEKTINKKENQYWRYFHERNFADIENVDDDIE